MKFHGVIYMLYNNINGHAYIGQAIDFDDRMSSHLCAANSKSPVCLIDKKIKKYGWDNFDKLIIATAYNQDHMNELEIHYIKFYETQAKYGHGHYNIMEGGAHGKHSEETKDLMSFNMLGSKNHMFGKKASKETRAKQSKALKGRPRSAAVRAKISKSHEGKTHSEKTKAKLREDKKYKMKPVECINTGQAFESGNDCARIMGIDRGNLHAHLKGKTHHIKGLRFRYIEKTNG